MSFDRKKILGMLDDPDAMKDIVRMSEINRKVKRGQISEEEAAEKVADLAEENESLKEMVGLALEQFSYGSLQDKIKEEMVERFGEDYDESE